MKVRKILEIFLGSGRKSMEKVSGKWGKSNRNVRKTNKNWKLLGKFIETRKGMWGMSDRNGENFNMVSTGLKSLEKVRNLKSRSECL